MRVDAALTDQPQRVKAFEQRLADLRTLANQYEHLRVFQAYGQRVEVLRYSHQEKEAAHKFVPTEFGVCLQILRYPPLSRLEF
jgi:hypothetical protein